MPKPKFGGRTGHLYGEMLMTAGSRDSITVAFDKREIAMPREASQSPEGKWGMAIGVSGARYVDDGTKVDEATRQKIESEFTTAFQRMDTYLKIE